MRKISLLILFTNTLIIALSSKGFGQVQTDSNSQFSSTVDSEGPISNMSSIVDLASGAVNYSIPLANVKGDNISIPISLNYKRNGIRVSERASWTGLGWDLGIPITLHRKVIGLPDDSYRLFNGVGGAYTSFSQEDVGFNSSDEVTEGEFHVPLQYILNPDNYLGSLTTLQNSGLGLADFQFDEFYFSLPGMSGMFVLDTRLEAQPIEYQIKTRDGKEYYLIPNIVVPFQDLNIWTEFSSDGGLSSFIIETPDGMEYMFVAIGVTAVLEEDTPPSRLYDWSNGVLDQKNIFHLVKVFNPYDEIEIEVVYSIYSEHPSFEQIWVNSSKTKLDISDSFNGSSNETTSYTLEITNPCIESGLLCNNPQEQEDHPSTKRIYHTIIYPVSISSKYGSVELITSSINRLDIPTDRFLEKVVVRNAIEETLTQYNLQYRYTGVQNTQTRLILDRIDLVNSLLENKTAYTFSYNEDNLLPAYSSNAVDHWGYFNGAPNQTLLPFNQNFSSLVSHSLANRDSDFNFAQSQSLKSIKNSSGEITEFIYESNEYSLLRGTPIGYNNSAGGIRVKEVRIKDAFDSSSELIYSITYNERGTSISSGNVDIEPSYTTYTTSLSGMVRRISMLDSGPIFWSECHNCFSNQLNSVSAYAGELSKRGLPTYGEVTVSRPNAGGITYKYSYHPINESDIAFPFIPLLDNGYSSNLIEKIVFNEQGALLRLENIEYENVYVADQKVLSVKSMRIPDPEFNALDDLHFMYKEYYYTTRAIKRVRTTVQIFDQSNPSRSTEQRTEFEYDSENPNVIRETRMYTCDPRYPLMVTRTKLVKEYASTSGSDDTMISSLNYLVNEGKFGLNTPVETITLRGQSMDDLQVIGGFINTFKLHNGKVVSDVIMNLVLDAPISEEQFTWSAVEGGVFTFDENYRKLLDETQYNSEHRVICTKPHNDIPTTTIYNENGFIIAEVINASPEQCSYDSFEQDEQTTWNINPSNIEDQSTSVLGLQLKRSKTGLRSLNLAENISKSLAPGKYIISIWATSSLFTLSCNGISQNRIIDLEGQDLQGWAYYEYLIDASSNAFIQINGNATILIDELRVYPWDAQMNSASYNLDGTIRNECDVNNFVSTLLYDGWKRQEWKLDDRLQILSKITYHDRDLSDPSDRSWMSEAVVLEQGMSAFEVINANPSDSRLRVTKQYYDGFGRNIQTLAVRQSGNSAKDLVSFHIYDGIGREAKAYLPFASQNNNNGNYIENPESDQGQFYQSTLYVAHTDFPYSETVFENSPINRVLELGSVGEAWQIGGNHTTRIGHQFNDPNEVLLWQPTEAGCSAMNSEAVVYYPVNSLQKTFVVDGSGASYWEFTDVYGKLVCKRTFALMSGSIDSPSFNHVGTGRISDNSTATPIGGGPTLRKLDVYFVYDDFGNLIYEIPAIASLAMGANQQFSSIEGGLNYSIFDGYMTSSRYDKFGNVIAKKKPSEGWSFYVYNKLGQVVLSKTPSQSEAGNEWNFVKYDKLGRPIQTGIYSSTLSREQLQILAYYGAIISEDRTGNISNVYTNETFPNTNLEILTETFYDNYDFDINGFTYSYATPVLVAQSRRTKGIATGSHVKVLDGENDFLVSVSYYDVFGRPAVQFGENLLGGFDKITNLYDYNGALVESRRYFKPSNGDNESIHVVNYFEYDHAGRLTITKQRINNDEEIVLSKLIYNALGQVVKKHLHIAGTANTGMQVVDYRYNEKGWLKKINNADLSNDGDNLESWDVFGQEIIYNDIENYYSNTMQAISQFGGNISAVKWKTNVTGEDPNQMGGHSYVFRYDDLGQMTGAYYAASNDDFIDNYNTRMNHWDERVSYDSNGNILSIYRSRGKNEEGIVLPTNALNPINMDILTYNYNEHSNILKSITDAASTGWVSNTLSNPFSHFVDGNTTATDYFYDHEGRLTKDENKGLEFSYNHLDLVEKAKYGTEEVRFIWDATGVKLAKQVGTNITYFFGGIEYTNNTITHLATSEGIARPASGTANSTEWHYDYYIKDHLGNVRAVITEENSELESERVTVELARRILEDGSFDNVTATEKDKPYMYPYDPYDPNNQKVSELSILTGKIIGPAKVMAVKRGEKVDLSTKYWYTEEPGTPLTDLTEILAGTLFNLGMAGAGIIPYGPEAGMALLNNVSGDQFGNLSNFLANSFDAVDLQRPRAFIVYMSFDKNMMLDPRNSGKIQVSDANTLGQLSKQDIIFRTDGYFYVYVTNQSETHVNFDNLVIRRWKPQVRVTYDYYPFGLAWENPKLPGSEEGLHDYTYQDKEYQFAEFADGRGLELHDFHARMYDATTGRWLVPDPAAQFANPYLAMGNSPIIQIDPTGTFSEDYDGWVKNEKNEWFWDPKATAENYQSLHPNAKGYTAGGYTFTHSKTNQLAEAGELIYLGENGYWYKLIGEGRLVIGEGQQQRLEPKGVDSQLLTHAYGGTYALVPYNTPTLAGLQTVDITPNDNFSETTALQWEQFNEEFNQQFQFYMNGDLRDFLDEVAITEALIAVDILTAGTGSTTLRGASSMKAAKTSTTVFHKHHVIPNQVFKSFKTELNAMGWKQNNMWNLKKLPTPFHGNHPAYNSYIKNEMNLLKQSGNLNLNSMQNLQHNMRLMIGDAYRSGGTLNQYFKF